MGHQLTSISRHNAAKDGQVMLHCLITLFSTVPMIWPIHLSHAMSMTWIGLRHERRRQAPNIPRRYAAHFAKRTPVSRARIRNSDSSSRGSPTIYTRDVENDRFFSASVGDTSRKNIPDATPLPRAPRIALPELYASQVPRRFDTRLTPTVSDADDAYYRRSLSQLGHKNADRNAPRNGTGRYYRAPYARFVPLADVRGGYTSRTTLYRATNTQGRCSATRS